MINPLQYFWTIRYLKPSQVIHRILFSLSNPKPNTQPASALRQRRGVWISPISKSRPLIEPWRFRFLNKERELTSAADWNNPAWEKLWLFNLHYFDELGAEGAANRKDTHRALILRWIDENPPGRGNGWEPYPLSLRIVNWIKWALAGNELDGAMAHSLAVQARYLARRMEYHLLGNHLIANVKALIFAGAFFSGNEAEQWLQLGVRILERELAEQLLPDGGHFERSPMYHAIVLEDLLDIANIVDAYRVRGDCVDRLRMRVRELLPKMLWWLRAMSHPDGRIALFNDAAFGIAAEPDQLDAYMTKIGVERSMKPIDTVTALESSGYVRAQCGELLLLADTAPIGPDYLPGHAHADSLTFELSYRGQRIIVDSGTSCYKTGAQRQLERSTAAHNTVTIDGQDSSEVWAGFRVARRARIVERAANEHAAGCTIRGAHDGYRRLPGVGLHRREWEVSGNRLVVTETIEGRGEHEIVAALHFAPGFSLREVGGNRLVIRGNGGVIGILTLDSRAVVAVETSLYHPEFGIGVGNCRVSCAVKAKLPITLQTHISMDAVPALDYKQGNKL